MIIPMVVLELSTGINDTTAAFIKTGNHVANKIVFALLHTVS